MRCITIEHTVDAYHVGFLLKQAKSKWTALPPQIKKAIDEDRILIGGSKMQVQTSVGKVDAFDGDMIYIKRDDTLCVSTEDKFFQRYKDAVCG